MDAILEKAAVIEIGNFHTKVGFAGESGPRHIIRTPSFARFFGPEGDSVAALVGTDEEFEKFLRRVFFNLLQVNPSDTPVFMLEGVLTTDTSRDALLNGLLSQLGVPSVTPVPQPVAAVHGAGLDSGIVLDVGHRDSCCIAVVDGAALYHTTQCSRAAAAMVDSVIAEANPELSNDCIQDVKAMLCRVRDPSKEEDSTAAAEMHALRGQPINDGGRICTAAPEILFQSDESDCSTLTELVLSTLLLAPRELRSSLAGKIVLCGGGSMLPGLACRLEHELHDAVRMDPRFELMVGDIAARLKPLFTVVPTVFEPNCVGWGGVSVLSSVKGINWVQCGRVTREKYMAALCDHGTASRSFMPAWNHLHYGNVLEEESSVPINSHKPTYRWQVSVE